MVFDDIMGVSGYEIPKSVTVKSYKLGITRSLLMFITFVLYVIYDGMYVNKMYLKVFPIVGIMRVQLQHPVSRCDPLDEDCNSAYRRFDEMPYCKQNKQVNTLGRDIPQETCDYMDEFDLPAQPFESSQVMIPTRTSVLKQKQLCNNGDQDCKRKYELIGDPITTYNADVENFTLLFDHSMVCEELSKNAHEWDLVGFLRPCGPPHNCPLVALPTAKGFDKQRHVSDELHKRARYFFNVHAEIPAKDASRTPSGDTFRLGYLLEIMNIDLDKTKNLKGHNLRHEGMSLMLEIKYTNFLHNTRPNKMPIVYEYRFTPATFQTYKATEARRDLAGKERSIFDVHGIYLQARQTGHIGAFSLRSLLLMLLEASVLLGLARWLVSFVTLNWWVGKAGDDLEGIAQDVTEFRTSEKDGEKGVTRLKRVPKVVPKKASSSNSRDGETFLRLDAQESGAGSNRDRCKSTWSR